MLSEIVNELTANLNLKTDEYFNGYEIVIENKNPLISIDPKHHDRFFGPKVLNLLIISQPFGWVDNETFSWPPEGFEESLARIREKYPQWSMYKVLVYADRTLSNEFSDATLDDMMTATFNQMETLCADNGDIGFIWMGEVTPSMELFKSVIDEHFGHS